jgi:hypothetical protein
VLELLGNLIIAVIAIAILLIAVIAIPILLVIIGITVVLCITVLLNVVSLFQESDSSSYKTEIENRSEKSDKLFESPKPEIEKKNFEKPVFEKAVDDL